MDTHERKPYLDALRIPACLGVIYNHVAGRSMRLYEGASGAAALWLFFVSKAAVALFLMISGALLLGRTDTYARSWKRVLRMAAALLVCSLLYYAVRLLQSGAPFLPAEFAADVWHYGITGSYWYLYLYLGLLVMMPLLQRLAAGMTDADMRYLLLWSVLIGGGMLLVTHFVPEAAFHGNFALCLLPVCVGLPFLGRYLAGRAPGRAVLWASAAAALLVPAIPAAACFLTKGAPFGLFDNYDILTATVPAAGLFVLVKAFYEKRRMREKTGDLLCRVGRLTFGVYLLSDLLIELLEPLRAALAAALSDNLAGALFVAVIFAAGALFTFLLRLIPGVKRIL